MINTVLFDMGGTLEDIISDADSRVQSVAGVLEILSRHGITLPGTVESVDETVFQGWKRYYQFRDQTMRELKPEEIWGDYVLRDFGLSAAQVEPISEELARMWELTYYRRELRPHVREMLEGLKSLGMKLGIISNTASLFQVFEVLEQYGIRDFFDDVTLSSVTGYRKPHENIFRVSLHQVQADPADCAYVGDTYSRDVMGPMKLGFGMTFHIHSFLTNQRDADVPKEIKPTYSMEDIYEVYTILRDLKNAQ